LRTPNDLPLLVGAGEYYINCRITRGIINHRTGLSFPDERGEKRREERWPINFTKTTVCRECFIQLSANAPHYVEPRKEVTPKPKTPAASCQFAVLVCTEGASATQEMHSPSIMTSPQEKLKSK
jgi:hypothetical protein